jgi:hypothetical protein
MNATSAAETNTHAVAPESMVAVLNMKAPYCLDDDVTVGGDYFGCVSSP